MTAQVLDLILIAVVLGSAFNGWRRGLVATIGSLAGAVVGALVAQKVAAGIPDPRSSLTPASVATWAGVWGGALVIGAALGGYLGSAVRDVVTWRWLRSIDRVAGAAFAVTAWSFALWAGSTAALNTPVSSVSALVNGSRVVAVLDEYMPESGRHVFEALSNSVSDAGLPTGLTEALLAPTVDAPSPDLVSVATVKRAVKSVVRVEGTSTSCNLRVTGTGFVARSGYVMTNAHVVAGVNEVGVRILGKGRLYQGTVVYFDPAIDIAIIRVGKLRSPALTIGSDQRRGTEVVVSGFPGGGHLTLVPARVRSVVTSKGTDIYGTRAVRRQIYALRADVKQGDSGAPLIAADGSVVGMVFASSATDVETGYALVSSLLTDALDEAKGADTQVDTGACVGD